MIDLRLGEFYLEEQNLKKLVADIKNNPGSCDEVWLNSYYGFPPLEKHRAKAEKMKVAKAYFENNGIDVSVQISNTLGHGQFHAATNDYSGLVYDGSPTEKMADADGAVAEYCFCIFGENYRKYMTDVIKIYAELKPKCMWIDDDLRALNHSPVQHSCFCDDCVARFNNTYGTSFTREELVNEINYGDIIWRERFIKQMQEGFYGLTAVMTKAAMEVSPETQMGYQYGRFYNYLGNDYTYVLDAMYDESKKPVKTRPGGGFYNDKNPLDMLQKAMEVSSANSVLPDYVSHSCPEIESTPDVFFGKSLEGTCKESTLYLAYGCNGLTYAALNNGYETENYNERLLNWFSKYRPYWNKLIAHNEGTKNGGLAVYSSENAYKKPLKEGDEPFSWKDIIGAGNTGMLKVGMPVSHDMSSASAFLLYADAVDYMTDNDIKELLKKPVLTDSEAVRKIKERGFENAFGIDLKPIDTNSAREMFKDHIVNKGYEGKRWKASLFTSYSWKGATEIIDRDGKTEFLGEYINIFDGHSHGNINAVCNTYDKNGNNQAKWAVFGYSLWEDVISSAKRNQIIGAADYICGNSLPARLISPEQVAVVPRVDGEGKTTCVSLINISIGTTEDMELVIRKPSAEKFTIVGVNKEEKLSFNKKGNDYVLTIPKLNPWEIITVFC